ncbi:MAG: extracellular solute-binding protein [Pseudotabrizicola sp.]|uniref:extracellular solute-binding protein n=1 Tax=Pseudotabrizicola sp. TaxID=2939647 RepID=UPI0027317015|nr:extracellular solute-binding protein [Pseudotabrizicola sp.]MDP2080375.1 extracellular solute-binding protein [Pseudotabrizicola sp.]MDZ7573781.1 extracellular solute-binding protein [Pseudotabrizicola sp.]
MKRSIVLGAAFTAVLSLPVAAQTLNVVTAGDTNMVDYINDYLGPLFEEQNPGVTVRALGTGPGDGGSQALYEKLSAQKGNDVWDVDVGVVHQRMAGQMVSEGLLQSYRDRAATGSLVTADSAENALGVDVGGYVMPMFQSQIAIAYNPALVSAPPQSYAELADWAAANPGQFGYNGITGGMAGVGFVFGWMYAFSDMSETLRNGPFDAAAAANWTPALEGLKQFNTVATITPGNAGTLDAMNRGEIAMGPVWMDMFYTWVADGRLNPDLKLLIPAPGMPGQPMYYVVPDKAAQTDLAVKFIELATSPEVQAEGIVRRFNWLPGIDANAVKENLTVEEWGVLFTDVSPEVLAERGLSMPQADYFRTILESYERQVAN